MQMEQLKKVFGKIMYNTDKELKHGQMETNTLENLKMMYNTDKELPRGQMEQNTLENIKMANKTDKEHR